MAEPPEKNTQNSFLPFYLFNLWEGQKTGRLLLNPGPYEKVFCLVKGELTPVKKYFPEKDFLDWLQETGRIEPPLRLNRQLLGADNISSILAVLIEHGFLPAREALDLTAEFLAVKLIDYFNLPRSGCCSKKKTFPPRRLSFWGCSPRTLSSAVSDRYPG